MKKLFTSILVVSVLILVVTSCSKEEDDLTPGIGHDGQQVTYTVQIPGIEESRAINPYNVKVGEGKLATKLIYAMYENGAHEKGVLNAGFVNDAAEGETADGTFTVSLTLAKNINYDILFMAYNPDNCIFDIAGKTAKQINLKELTLKNRLKANQEQYDAFVGRLIGQNINSASNTVTLYRPFAQVNVATTSDDLNAVQNLKSEVIKSDFVIEDVPNKLDIFDGKVSGSTEIHYASADIFKKYDATRYPYNELISVDGTNYYYLAMSYVLAGITTSTHDLKFNFYRTDGKPVSDLDVPGVPVQANYRTNIVGTILTQQESYEVKINPIFVQDNEILTNKAEVSTFDELLGAVAATTGNVPTIITLKDDITIASRALSSRASNSDYITIAAGKNIILDLNGKTIKLEKECTASFEMINNKGTLTIKDSSDGDGKISFKDTSVGDPNFGWGSYTVRNEGTLVVEGGTIEHLGEQAFATHMICAIFQYSGSTTINGGTISTPNYRSARLWSGDMTINGGTFDGQLWVQAVDDTANLAIKGGNFSPNGNDGSSIFVTNDKYDVNFAVTGGTFNTKIGCSDASKLAGCITGGKFTTEAKENTNTVLFNEAYKLVESNGYWSLQADPVAKIG